MKTTSRILLVTAGVVLASGLGLVLFAQTSVQSVQTVISSARALAASEPVAEKTVPLVSTEPWSPPGTYWTLQADWPPMPFDLFPELPVYSVGNDTYLIDDRSVDYEAMQQAAEEQAAMETAVKTLAKVASRGGRISLMDLSGSDPSEAMMSYSSNDLWLEITGVSNGLAYLNLHGATDMVYEVRSKTDLTAPSWNIEQEVWPTNPAVMPFIVAELGRTNLFIWARDWTGVTENGNTTPDWWFWEYFGTVALSDTNLDSQGNTLLYDYQYGLDPNIISFGLSYTNQYVPASGAPLQINVSQGVPFYFAVVLDSTNFTGATWTSYTSSNLIVNLGTTQGWHDVWVGLRGLPAKATQTWQWARFKLDLTPPVLVFTNPVSPTVSQPVIQLQGYCPEPLAGISYDLANAAGLVTNQQVLVTGQSYDTNALDFSTNYFQAFDVGLTNGANTITLHATDMAGNVTTTNLTFTLDYSGKTNPPTIQVFWPPQGAQIATSNFTCRGWVSDPTATVVAQMVDAYGTTNSFYGRVGRDGNFWIDGLPLTGSNTFSLTATDAAGNSSGSSVSANKSDVTLTIDDASFTSAYGTISDTNHTILVNGVEAEVWDWGDGEAEWWAPVELTLDDTHIQIHVEPNSGSYGSSGGADAEIEVPWPSGTVYLNSYHQMYDWVHWTTNQDIGVLVGHVRINWDEIKGGDGYYYADIPVCYGGGYGEETYSWAGGRWPIFGSGVATDLITGQTNAEGPPLCYPSFEDYTVYLDYGEPDWDWYRLKGQGEATLVTGGLAGSTDRALFLISASATVITPVVGVLDIPVPPDQITIPNLAKFDTNGHLYVVLPERQQMNATAHVNGAQQGDFNVSSVPYKPHIFFNGQDVTGTDMTVVVGQNIGLSCSFPGPLPTNFPPVTSHQWTIPGYAISNYVANANVGIVYPNFPTANSNAVFYWVDGGRKQVQCTVKVLGQELTAKATFNVLRPEATWTLTPRDHVAVDANVCDPNFPDYYHLRTGKKCTTNDVGMLYEFQATDMKGYQGGEHGVYQFQFVQVITADWKINLDMGAPGTNFSKYVTMRGLDTDYPYERWFFQSGEATDTPWNVLIDGYAFVWRQDNFESYLMFKPEGGIPVPLKMATWNWYGRAEKVGTNYPPQFVGVPPFVDPQPAVGVDSLCFPEWTNNIANANWTYQMFWFPTP